MCEQMLVEHCSPTLAGLKTGSLVLIRYRDSSELTADLRDINRRLTPKGLRTVPLRYRNGTALIYAYRPSRLAKDRKDAAAGFSAADVAAYDAIAFGCPSMGAEQLEEEEFEPMFASVESSLAGKKIGLFGSWGWGEGAWMKDWEERCRADGADLQGDGVTCQEAPDDAALAACRELGAKLA